MKKASISSEHPMRWFKFLIYFSLWAAAALMAARGIGYFTGIAYRDGSGLTADTVYGNFPGLRVWDRLYGAGLFLLGAFHIFTRFRLSRFKSNGPVCLYCGYGLQAALTVVNAVAVASITGTSGAAGAMASALAAAALIVLNRSYFKKRGELFKN